MLYIINENTNPYFNLASEEYLLKNFKDDCFMLWRNSPSIIVGKHQNTLAEINLEYIQNKDINVARRLSGGGTVYHDLGNLNFTFIQNVEKNKGAVDFKKYTKPIIEVLIKLGVNAKLEGRNDIMIEKKKISGNAEHVFKNRVLHHGTLLFSSDLSILSQALKAGPLKYNDKGVKSVRSRVTNISEYLKEKLTIQQFQNLIQQHISTLNNVREYILEERDILIINQLVEKKYNTWEWNFGYSPKYNFKKNIKLKKGNIEIFLIVQKGIITDVKIDGNFFNQYSKEILAKKLTGLKHEIKTVQKTLQKLNDNNFDKTLNASELALAVF